MGYGLCTGEELLQDGWKAIQEAIKINEINILLDARNTELDITLDDLKKLIEFNRRHIEQGKKPVKIAVLSMNSFMFTLDKILHTMAENQPLYTGIFNQSKSAIKWLGLHSAENKITAIGETLLMELENSHGK